MISEVLPGVFKIAGLEANCFAWCVGHQVAVIDTGLPGHATRILSDLQDLRDGQTRLSQILLTHADVDHAGNAAALQRVTGARILVSATESARLKSGRVGRPRQGGPPLLTGLLNTLRRRIRIPAPPAETIQVLRDGEVLTEWDGLVVVETSGHVIGHLSFYYPRRGILFAGDALTTAAGHLAPTPPGVTQDPERARASVRRLQALKAEFVVCGHGDLEPRQAALQLAALA